MGEKEFADLCADIREHGQRQEIILFAGQILDGRNRYLACRHLGIEPRFAEFDGNCGSPLDYVISHNLNRRHLSESQRAMVAERVAQLRREFGRDFDTDAAAPIGASLTQTQAALVFNVSRQSITRARRVRSKGVTALVEQVEAGKLSVSAAAKIAELPKGKQMRLIRSGDKGKMVSLASKLRVESALEHAHTTYDACLLCNADIPVNETTFLAYLEAAAHRIASRPGGSKWARYLRANIEEITELQVADEVQDIYERILSVLEHCPQSEADIARLARLNRDECHFAIERMHEGGSIEPVRQGGKTEVARGRVKTLWQRRQPPRIADPVPAVEEDDDDEYVVRATTSTSAAVASSQAPRRRRPGAAVAAPATPGVTTKRILPPPPAAAAAVAGGGGGGCSAGSSRPGLRAAA